MIQRFLTNKRSSIAAAISCLATSLLSLSTMLLVLSTSAIPTVLSTSAIPTVLSTAALPPVLSTAVLPLVLSIATATPALAQSSRPSNLSETTVLVIRHAEKPPAGDGLTPAGQARAEAYAKYFHPFNDGTESFNIDSLYATSDTTKSARPKLTLAPLSEAMNLPIDTRFGNYDFDFLAHSLRHEQHGKHVLIAWHHGKIPDLLNSLGVDSTTVLPNGRWPDNVYDWVIEIKYDKNGKVAKAQRIQEQISNATAQAE